MARLDWDRLRRIRPLDGADVRVDTDGAHVWERPSEDAFVPLGSRRLRRGVVVRRREQRTTAEAASLGEAKPDAGPGTACRPSSAAVRCHRCGARVSRRKLLRHARRCPRMSESPTAERLEHAAATRNR
jgi:hypothetical protein